MGVSPQQMKDDAGGGSVYCSIIRVQAAHLPQASEGIYARSLGYRALLRAVAVPSRQLHQGSCYDAGLARKL